MLPFTLYRIRQRNPRGRLWGISPSRHSTICAGQPKVGFKHGARLIVRGKKSLAKFFQTIYHSY